MGNSFSNSVNINTQVTNQILNDVTQTCNSVCDANASGNTIIINGGTVNGSINISTKCTASASCAMSNISNTAIQNIVQNMVQQEITSVTDFMGDLDFQNLNNSININTGISNYVTQITTQTCNAVTEVSDNDTFIYVSSGPLGEGGVINGNINIAAEGNSSANCAMSNVSKVQAYNQAQNTTTQSITSIGMFVAIVAIIAVVVLIGGLIYVMMYARGAFGGAVDPLESGELDPEVVNQLLKGRNINAYSQIPPGVRGERTPSITTVSSRGKTGTTSPSYNKIVTKTSVPLSPEGKKLPPKLPPRGTKSETQKKI